MKIISFHGGDSQVGTSMISQSVGELLSEKEYKVFLIFASSNYGDDFIISANTSIDDIKENLREGKLSKNDLSRVTCRKGGLIFLPGTRKMEEIRYFGIQDVMTIIETLKGGYDFVIIDGGYNINLPLTVSSLMATDKRYFVITQQEKSIRRFKFIKELLLDQKGLKGKLIVNKYKDLDSLYSKDHIEFLLGESIEEIIKFCPGEWESEIQKETFLYNDAYRESIERIVDRIVREREEINEGGRDNLTKGKRRIFFR